MHTKDIQKALLGIPMTGTIQIDSKNLFYKIIKDGDYLKVDHGWNKGGQEGWESCPTLIGDYCGDNFSGQDDDAEIRVKIRVHYPFNMGSLYGNYILIPANKIDSLKPVITTIILCNVNKVFADDLAKMIGSKFESGIKVITAHDYSTAINAVPGKEPCILVTDETISDETHGNAKKVVSIMPLVTAAKTKNKNCKLMLYHTSSSNMDNSKFDFALNYLEQNSVEKLLEKIKTFVI